MSPAIAGLDGPVHVHVLPQTRPHLGPVALHGPQAGDVRLLRDPGGVEEEIPLVGPGLLDLAPHAVKKSLLLGGIASRRSGARSQECEAQAVQHAQQRAGGEDLAEDLLDVEGRRASRPVVEKVPELAGGRQHGVPDIHLLGGGQGGGASGAFFLKSPSRPASLNASTQRRTVLALTPHIFATPSAFFIFFIRMIACRRRTLSGSSSLL